MTSLRVAGITEMGCHIYTEIRVNEDYTMNQVVNEVKRVGFVSFRLVDSMNGYVKVQG